MLQSKDYHLHFCDVPKREIDDVLLERVGLPHVPKRLSVSPRPFGFGFGVGVKGVGPGLDNEMVV